MVVDNAEGTCAAVSGVPRLRHGGPLGCAVEAPKGPPCAPTSSSHHRAESATVGATTSARSA
jgi:hypothetical protein